MIRKIKEKKVSVMRLEASGQSRNHYLSLWDPQRLLYAHGGNIYTFLSQVRLCLCRVLDHCLLVKHFILWAYKVSSKTRQNKTNRINIRMQHKIPKALCLPKSKPIEIFRKNCKLQFVLNQNGNVLDGILPASERDAMAKKEISDFFHIHSVFM